MGFNFEIIKEPRGFIKIIQIFLAICAFATTVDFSIIIHGSIHCPPENSTKYVNYSLPIPYPFVVSYHDIPSCESATAVKKFYGDFSSASKFFVFTGVITFLYCLGVLFVYIYYGDLYANNDRFGKMDFVLTIFVAVLWLVASSVWADGVNQFKWYTSMDRICNQIAIPDSKCTTDSPTFGGLNISLIFGFLNMAVWVSSLWFIWKETSWSHKNDSLVEPGIISDADGSPM